MHVATVRIAAITGFLAVLLGAMGAHGTLHDRLVAAGELDHWRTAVEYHLVHAVVLLALSFTVDRGGRMARWAWWAFITGVVLFSGSLYILALTGISWLGAVTPLGGLALLKGWALLFLTRWGNGR